MERFGLRICTICNIVVLFGISALRFAAQTNSITSLVLWILSAVLVGVSGPMVMALPGYLAELWFIPRHRATATAIAVEASTIGSAFAYLLPGLLPQNTISDLNRVNVLCLGLSVGLLLCCACFPSRPSIPPSRSAAVNAEGSEERPPATLFGMLRGVVALARNSQFVVVVLVYGVVLGFNGAWSTTLNLNLSQSKLSQNFTGYIGFSGMVWSAARLNMILLDCHLTLHMPPAPVLLCIASWHHAWSHCRAHR